MTKAEILDQLEDSLLRAEKAGKDTDLLVALRALYIILKEQVKKEGEKHGDF